MATVRGWLRLEGASVLVLAILFYADHGPGWLAFALLLLAPDLSALGYLAGPRVGAATYNVAHAYALPLLLLAYGYWGGAATAVGGALIWLAHIGMDRMLGYGLKLPSGFQDTHLGRIGRGAAGG